MLWNADLKGTQEDQVIVCKIACHCAITAFSGSNNTEADAWELKAQVACSRGKKCQARAVCKELASSSCCCVDNHFHNVGDEASGAVHNDVSVLLHAPHITA